jgi:hypothetical protein
MPPKLRYLYWAALILSLWFFALVATIFLSLRNRSPFTWGCGLLALYISNFCSEMVAVCSVFASVSA